MALTAAVGWAQALDGREASARAVRQALDQMLRQPVKLAFLYASHEYAIQEALSGAAALLGEAPLLGLSTLGEFADRQTARRSVSVALLGGDGLQAQAGWWPGFGQNGAASAEQLTQELLKEGEPQTGQDEPLRGLFLAADGVSGDGQALGQALPFGSFPLAGGLAAGDLHLGRTSQIGGRKAGTGGLAAATLKGELRVGVGVAHGWQPVGAYFQVTRAQGPWVRALDGRPASETYARLFGYEARAWSFPPLNQLVRLYPLGVEQPDSQELLVRSPLRVEADGSLRMNTAVAEGSICHLMVGSTDACLDAARKAARQALAELGGANPVLGLVLADAAWGHLLETQAGAVLQALQETLGPIPLTGGYTLGQFSRSTDSGIVQLHNQHLEVVLFGAA